jgi:hypothetical protein
MARWEFVLIEDCSVVRFVIDQSRVDDPSEKPRIIFGCIKDLHPTLQRTRPAIFATNASAALD